MLEEAVAAGDHSAALRARVALAHLALEHGEYERAARQRRAPSPTKSSLRPSGSRSTRTSAAYASSGRPDRAAELFQSCLDGVADAGGDASLEARYATLLSYALTDMGEHRSSRRGRA